MDLTFKAAGYVDIVDEFACGRAVWRMLQKKNTVLFALVLRFTLLSLFLTVGGDGRGGRASLDVQVKGNHERLQFQRSPVLVSCAAYKFIRE